MSIISRSYFVGENRIANALDTNPDKQLLGTGETLDLFIEKYEREVLLKCFGYSLYKLFIDQFSVNTEGRHELNQGVDEKWDDLLNGHEYTIDGVSVLWRGLIFTDTIVPQTLESYPQSLIADYVFAKYIFQEELVNEATGYQIPKVKNSQWVSGRGKWAQAMNRVYQKVSGSEVPSERSLYQYIQDMNSLDATTFPNWDPHTFKQENRFGL